MSAAASGLANNGSNAADADSGGPGSGGGAARQEVVPEMPPDLLKFLTDMGPLRKIVDESATSSRIYEVFEKGGTRVRDEHAKAANARIRRRMPLVEESSSSSRQQRRGDDTGSRDEMTVIHDGRTDENYDDDEVDDDGTMVTRTTNFSTVDRRSSSAHRGRLSVTREDYFRILSVIRRYYYNQQWQ